MKVAILALALLTTSVAGCNTTTVPPAGTVTTVRLDVAKAQIAARALQAQVDAAIIRLHASGALTGQRFNNMKALALQGDSYLDKADDAVSVGNAVLASSLITQAVTILVQAQTADAK